MSGPEKLFGFTSQDAGQHSFFYPQRKKATKRPPADVSSTATPSPVPRSVISVTPQGLNRCIEMFTLTKEPALWTASFRSACTTPRARILWRRPLRGVTSSRSAQSPPLDPKYKQAREWWLALPSALYVWRSHYLKLLQNTLHEQNVRSPDLFACVATLEMPPRPAALGKPVTMKIKDQTGTLRSK